MGDIIVGSHGKIKHKKFNKKAWSKLKGCIDGWRGELHHLVKGQKDEYLCCMRLMSVEEHTGHGHARNWAGVNLIPHSVQEDCLKAWKEILTEQEYEWFVNNGYERP